jgi:hypothetical protein
MAHGNDAPSSQSAAIAAIIEQHIDALRGGGLPDRAIHAAVAIVAYSNSEWNSSGNPGSWNARRK